MTPRAVHYLPQGYNLNNLSKGLLDRATYQRHLPFSSTQEDFYFSLSLFLSLSLSLSLHESMKFDLSDLGRGQLDEAMY